MKKSERMTNQSRTNREKKNGFLRYLQRDWQLYVLMILPMLFILVFKFLPYSGLSSAFKDYKVAKGIPEVHGWDFLCFRRCLENGILVRP